jgi:hypothetical protein
VRDQVTSFYKNFFWTSEAALFSSIHVLPENGKSLDHNTAKKRKN